MTSVTQKGQVTIPKKIREKLGMEVYGKVIVSENRGSVKITPTQDILDLAGKLRAPKGKNALKARKAFEKNYKRF